MQTQPITIINKLGLHARATTKLVHLASRFGAIITLQKANTVVNAKDIMDVMMLAANCGTVLILTCDGENESEAMTALTALINRRFDEAE